MGRLLTKGLQSLAGLTRLYVRWAHSPMPDRRSRTLSTLLPAKAKGRVRDVCGLYLSFMTGVFHARLVVEPRCFGGRAQPDMREHYHQSSPANPGVEALKEE